MRVQHEARVRQDPTAQRVEDVVADLDHGAALVADEVVVDRFGEVPL